MSNYFKFKHTLTFEDYFSIKNKEMRVILTRFRISNHCLRIESGRYERKIDKHGKNITLLRSERTCQFSSMNLVEDEEHFYLNVPFIIRKEKPFWMNSLQNTHIYPKYPIVICLLGSCQTIALILTLNYVN